MITRILIVLLLTALVGCDRAERNEQRVRHPELDQVEEQVRRTIENALSRWRQALELSRDPTVRAAAYAELGQIYLAHRFSVAAADALGYATSADPQHASWHYYHSVALAQSFDFADAEFAVSKSLAIDDLAEARMHRAELRVRLGRTEEALTDLELLAQAPAEDDVASQVRGYLLASEVHASEGEYARAAAALEQAQALAPEALALNLSAARLSGLQGDRRAERRWRERAGPELPDTEPPLLRDLAKLARGSDYFLERGREWMRARHFQRATDDFAASVDIAPSSYAARLAYARALEIVGQTDEALEQYRAALTLQPEATVTHFFIGALYERRQEDDLARQSYARAVDVDPDYLPPRLALAHADFRQGEYASALTHYRIFAKRRPQDLESRYYAGLAALAMGDCEAAPEWFDEAMDVNSHSLAAQEGMSRSLAICSHDPDQLARAQDIAERLEESRPDAAAAATLAMVHAALNDFENAVRYQTLAVRRSDEQQSSIQIERLKLYESKERAKVAWREEDPVYRPPRLSTRVAP